MYDVVIIGAGVSGSASARELSRYKVNACVIEKTEDVCSGTSKANSGIVHAGFDAPEGSLMAKLNVEGNLMMEELSKELDFPFKKNGSLVICLSEEDMPKLKELYDRGIRNGVKELKILNKEEVLELEPNITDDVYAALYAPTGGIVCPFGLNIALAENANTNGIEFRFNTEAQDIEKIDGGFIIKTNQGDIKTKYIVNAAGVYADKFHNMVSQNKINITARKGEYCLLDKTAGNHVSRTIFALPGKMVADILKEKLNLEENPNFVGTRKGILDPNTLSLEERNQLIKEQPAYGNIICRCEMITEGEIIDAIRRPLGAKSLDGVKRRTRAGMGRCQAGFCSPKTMEILERELSISMFDITKAGGESNMVLGLVKDSI